MKQHIDTIPVLDAYRSDCECPLCVLHKKHEEEFVDVFLGASVMEPDRRVEVNEKGFCRRHFKMMFDAGNRLGLALMTDTYMKRTIEKLSQSAKRAAQIGEEEGKKSLIARVGRKNGDIVTVADEVAAMADKCIFCEKLDNTMERYVFTLVYLYKKESDFRDALAKSKGFCLDHYAQVLKAAPEQLSGKDLQAFIDLVTRVEMENLERVEKDLEWFTLKFDYRNKDKPWGNSQDAVERSVNKMRGGAV
ncbi:MAG: ABC transporter substrate-binding protein [Clostridia bacterium]|nr:ABC transporter substrate-binding protein [Clostridia bacterium]